YICPLAAAIFHRSSPSASADSPLRSFILFTTGRNIPGGAETMHFESRQSVLRVVALVLVTLFIVPMGLMAQSHVVSPADLQHQAVAASQVRQHNLETVQNFLSTPVAQKAMK